MTSLNNRKLKCIVRLNHSKIEFFKIKFRKKVGHLIKLNLISISILTVILILKFSECLGNKVG